MNPTQFRELMRRMDRANTTPVKISDEVQAFCAELAPGRTPEYVVVRGMEAAVENHCAVNVPTTVQREGGEAVPGWTIYEWPGAVLTAEAHLVWRSPSGELVDVTPKREQRILFLPDPAAPEISTANGATRPPNRYKALRDISAVHEFITTSLATGNMIKVGPNHLSYSEQLKLNGLQYRKAIAIERIFERLRGKRARK